MLDLKWGRKIRDGRDINEALIARFCLQNNLKKNMFRKNYLTHSFSLEALTKEYHLLNLEMLRPKENMKCFL